MKSETINMPRLVIVKMIIGVGGLTSAIRGASTVTKLAIKWQIPKIRTRKWAGKRSGVDK